MTTPSLPTAPPALRYRPLVWLAPAVVLGCALGGWLAVSINEKILRQSPLLPLLLAMASGTFLFALRWRKGGTLQAYIAIAIAALLFFTFHSARRIVPPSDDISMLARSKLSAQNGAIKQVPVMLEG